MHPLIEDANGAQQVANLIREAYDVAGKRPSGLHETEIRRWESQVQAAVKDAEEAEARLEKARREAGNEVWEVIMNRAIITIIASTKERALQLANAEIDRRNWRPITINEVTLVDRLEEAVDIENRD